MLKSLYEAGFLTKEEMESKRAEIPYKVTALEKFLRIAVNSYYYMNVMSCRGFVAHVFFHTKASLFGHRFFSYILMPKKIVIE